MNMLQKFKAKKSFEENERIHRLYTRVDMLSEGQIDDLIQIIFKTWINEGFIGRKLAEILAGKISVLIDSKADLTRDGFPAWFEKFRPVELEKKRALLVTVANDVCLLGFFQESDIFNRIDEFLKDVPGFIAGDREFDNPAPTTTKTKGTEK